MDQGGGNNKTGLVYYLFRNRDGDVKGRSFKR